MLFVGRVKQFFATEREPLIAGQKCVLINANGMKVLTFV